ncbi:hypothetical protein CH063_02432 [Colletotrichum higginsianum]|uniref:Transmembrane protein n=1 Tax=Colletotrichum higginsianum (strain IMI 349063) TaxID=759273 RepID=H1VKQ1_COLHI|nr:hypothetical protein CH063_02432 [Colletotrichum higginsianum]
MANMCPRGRRRSVASHYGCLNFTRLPGTALWEGKGQQRIMSIVYVIGLQVTRRVSQAQWRRGFYASCHLPPLFFLFLLFPSFFGGFFFLAPPCFSNHFALVTADLIRSPLFLTPRLENHHDWHAKRGFGPCGHPWSLISPLPFFPSPISSPLSSFGLGLGRGSCLIRGAGVGSGLSFGVRRRGLGYHHCGYVYSVGALCLRHGDGLFFSSVSSLGLVLRMSIWFANQSVVRSW